MNNCAPNVYDRRTCQIKRRQAMYNVMCRHYHGDQKIFASSMQVSEMTIRSWINGAKPSKKNIEILASKFNLNPVYLETGSGEMYLTM